MLPNAVHSFIFFQSLVLFRRCCKPSQCYPASMDRLLKICALVLLFGWQSSGFSIQQQLLLNQKGLQYKSAKALNSYYPRTCYQVKMSGDPTMTESGMYWIDPDGAGVGEGPIYVHCDLENGVTSVLHDAENEVQIPACPDTPECYKKDIQYRNATLKQMIALAQISEKCHQTIEVDCLRGPLEGLDANGKPKAFSWWLDRSGTEQYFWSGIGTDHTCQCGIENNCFLPNLKCNCDANVAIPLNDIGDITNKNLLPVTGLRFSNTKHEGGSHKLGKFTCSGKQELEAADGMPKSCEDLWLLGQTVNGLYFFVRSIDATVDFEVYNCDFQDTAGDIPVKGQLVSILQGLVPVP